MIRRNGDYDCEVRDGMRGGKGRVTIEHLWKREELNGKTRLCAKLTIPPGASIGFHEHVSEEEVYIITAGTGIITDNGNDEPIGPGDSILTGNGAGHAIACTGDTPLEFFAFIVEY